MEQEQEQEQEQILISSKSQLQDFIKFSPIWKDMENEMKAWLKDIRNQLENNDGSMSSRTLDRLGGNAESVRNLQNLPHVLLEILDNQK